MKYFSVLFLILALAGLAACAKVCPTCPKICTLEFEEVCSTSGCTYKNKCVLECAGEELKSLGPCP